MTVTFCGHRYTQDTPELRAWLADSVEKLIAEGADTFYLGGYGDFDRIAASVVWKLKKKYPHIESVLVLAYLGREVGAAAARRYAVRKNKRIINYGEGETYGGL